MSRASRDKGYRAERAIVDLHCRIGVHAERVPLSGAARYQGRANDVDVYARGDEHPPLLAEIKARGTGGGFKTLERWLGGHDALFLRRDRHAEPLVVLPWRIWADLIGR